LFLILCLLTLSLSHLITLSSLKQLQRMRHGARRGLLAA
jgi:hypothetical protein